MLSGKVKWKSGKKFEGPLLRCKIYKKGSNLYWVKNDRELICLNEHDGSERFKISTSPWLYTDLCFEEDRIIYGTSGADGFMNCIRYDNGERIWSFPLKNGEIIQQMSTAGEIVGQIFIYGNEIYTVVWGNVEQPPSIVKIAID